MLKLIHYFENEGYTKLHHKISSWFYMAAILPSMKRAQTWSSIGWILPRPPYTAPWRYRQQWCGLRQAFEAWLISLLYYSWYLGWILAFIIICRSRNIEWLFKKMIVEFIGNIQLAHWRRGWSRAAGTSSRRYLRLLDVAACCHPLIKKRLLC
jgi:hypothetical protein